MLPAYIALCNQGRCGIIWKGPERLCERNISIPIFISNVILLQPIHILNHSYCHGETKVELIQNGPQCTDGPREHMAKCVLCSCDCKPFHVNQNIAFLYKPKPIHMCSCFNVYIYIKTISSTKHYTRPRIYTDTHTSGLYICISQSKLFTLDY